MTDDLDPFTLHRAVIDRLRDAGRVAHLEHPGYVALYLPDGRYLASGLEGWGWADTCEADGDSAKDGSADLEHDGTAEGIAAALLEAAATFEASTPNTEG
jgi:hypothetical protein